MDLILGHHHTSMITKNAQENNYFYETILGLRRIKTTVNQDDPSMYHLFYGDEIGNPGTELTFFEIPLAGQTYHGSNAITQIGLIVPSIESLTYWENRFEKYDVKYGEITTYLNRPALHFQDYDGLRLVLIVADVDNKEAFIWQSWEESQVPKEHQIRGIGPVEITVRRLKKLRTTLTQLLNYAILDETDEQILFQSKEGYITSEIIVKLLDAPPERAGRGSVHHLAIRVKDEEQLKYWDEKIKKYGFESTGILDRFYFKSIYFRESNGILFELATDGPGFSVDEPIETLGESLALPPFLEDQREIIEEQLQPLNNMKEIRKCVRK